MAAWLHFALPGLGEITFLLTVIYCVFRAQKNRIYPAFWQFLFFWVVSDALMLGEDTIFHLHLITGTAAYHAYFYTYWITFAINTILILRVLHEMFRHAVRSVPGIQMLGRPIFFWAIVVSVILAFASGITPHAAGTSLIFATAQVLERSQSVLALCMLSFLAFASRTLRVSYGSRIFGVTFGFSLMALANLVISAFFANQPNLASVIAQAHEGVYLAAIAVWAAYFLKPEPVRRLVTIPTQSPLMRWNDVAQQLGNPAGQIPVSYPPTFMSGIQAFVDNVMGPFPASQSVSVRPPGPIAS
jgi:hypothetical protein